LFPVLVKQVFSYRYGAFDVFEKKKTCCLLIIIKKDLHQKRSMVIE
jgi:hypothetical protein